MKRTPLIIQHLETISARELSPGGVLTTYSAGMYSGLSVKDAGPPQPERLCLLVYLIVCERRKVPSAHDDVTTQ